MTCRCLISIMAQERAVVVLEPTGEHSVLPDDQAVLEPAGEHCTTR